MRLVMWSPATERPRGLVAMVLHIVVHNLCMDTTRHAAWRNRLVPGDEPVLVRSFESASGPPVPPWPLRRPPSPQAFSTGQGAPSRSFSPNAGIPDAVWCPPRVRRCHQDRKARPEPPCRGRNVSAVAAPRPCPIVGGTEGPPRQCGIPRPPDGCRPAAAAVRSHLDLRCGAVVSGLPWRRPGDDRMMVVRPAAAGGPGAAGRRRPPARQRSLAAGPSEAPPCVG
ncbi:hypothetical protein CcI6DRAFT_00466 [Frankia sp. CcI6]|nr:hypothetical protein CcI6DRAFT_00466 [Frankia sp. CcI6]KFB06839.1 hypothetical protein ALLO2DRAFT_00126 [Frankia sp. Allo2]OAA31136.1 hypothetical protein AAY23_100325 [Frankia casuarinae]